MKMVCKHKCYFDGRSVKKGDVVDIPDNLLNHDQVKSSFKVIEAEAPAAKPDEKKAKSDLTVEEMTRRLNEWGVNVPESAKPAEIKKLYLAQVAAKK